MTNKEAHYLIKIKGMWKLYTKTLYRRDKGMTDNFEEESHEEEPVSLKNEVKVVQKVLGINKSQR